MTDTAAATPPTPAPRRFNWLKIALVVSLALNLLFVGGGVARYLTHGPPDPMPSMSTQFFPRKFFWELDRDRRLELMQVFKDFRPRFREGRQEQRAAYVNLAAKLEADPYNPEDVQSAIKSFAAAGAQQNATGGDAAVLLVAKLTASERKLLAQHMRQRAEGSRRRDGRMHGGGDKD